MYFTILWTNLAILVQLANELMHPPYLFVWELCFLTFKKYIFLHTLSLGHKTFDDIETLPLKPGSGVHHIAIPSGFCALINVLPKCGPKWVRLLLQHFPGWSRLFHCLPLPLEAFPCPPLTHTHAHTHTHTCTHLISSFQKTRMQLDIII